jgi:AcrR family transcriptional regulator
MNDLNVLIKVDKQLYVKNPDSSDLGRKIITNSIEMINELGFEKFTFKKLSIQIKSTESSVYRYFENKHQLLLYLASWYWNWMYYQIVLATINIDLVDVKLKRTIDILTRDTKEDKSISYINEILLNKIIITESSKAIHTKNVDKENENGCFESYKKVINKVADLILEVNPEFEYAHMLVTTVIEGAQQQQYYIDHFPSLTDKVKAEDTIAAFYNGMIFKMIKKNEL